MEDVEDTWKRMPTFFISSISIWAITQEVYVGHLWRAKDSKHPLIYINEHSVIPTLQDYCGLNDISFISEFPVLLIYLKNYSSHSQSYNDHWDDFHLEL